MTTRSQLRKTALALPETEEGTRFGTAAFSVRGKEFVSITDDGWVQFKLPTERVEAALADHPASAALSW